MEYGAIDLHKHESQIRIVREDGAIVDQRTADTPPFNRKIIE
jgi:hypothetical protein